MENTKDLNRAPQQVHPVSAMNLLIVLAALTLPLCEFKNFRSVWKDIARETFSVKMLCLTVSESVELRTFDGWK